MIAGAGNNNDYQVAETPVHILNFKQILITSLSQSSISKSMLRETVIIHLNNFTTNVRGRAQIT